jgi:N-acetylmuramoyl-L-alanine amidase
MGAALAICAIVVFGPARLGRADQPKSAAIEADTVCKNKFATVIDVGHDGRQFGALSARGRREFEFNLALAQKVKETLVGRGLASTQLVVAEEGFGSLKRRVQVANDANPSLLLSIHHDSVQPTYLVPWVYEGRELRYSDKFSGYSLFVSSRNRYLAQSLRFAILLADQLISRDLAFSSHHAEDIPGERHQLLDSSRGIYGYDNLIILHSTNAPAVLLEAGVIVNRTDELALATEARRTLLAEAIADAVLNYCTGL